MGAPKTSTVGGGTASPVANSWNQFLQGQLYQTPGAQAIPQTMVQLPPRPPGMRDDLWNKMSAGFNNMNSAIAANQPPAQPGQFQQSLQAFMNPDIAGQIANNPWLSGAQGYNPTAQLPNAPNLPTLAMPGQPNMPNAPTWQGANFNPVGNVSAGAPIQAPTSQAATLDPMSFLSNFANSKDLLQQFGINPSGVNTAGPSNIPNFTPSQLSDPTSDPSFQAIQQIAERQKMQDVANLRARYGATGNTQSSGASLAESQYLAEANPRLIASMGDLGRQIQGLGLQQQGINNQQQLGLAGLGVQDVLGRLGIGANQNTANTGNLLSYIQGTRGQDIGTASNLAGQNLSNQQGTNNLNANNILQALMSNAGNTLSASGQNAQNQLGMNQLFGQQGIAQNNFLSNLFGQGSQNALNLFGQNSANELNAYNAQVNPLLQLFGQQSSNALNNQGMANNWMSSLLNGGLNLQQLAQQGQLTGLNNLFSSFNQSNQIGTPQAQTVQTPSQFSQIAGMIGSLAPLIPGLSPVAGAAGMLSGAMQAPQVQQLGQNFVPNFGFNQPGGMNIPPGTGGFNYRIG